MSVPHSVLAAGWIPFVVCVILTIIFSFFYIRYFQSKYESEVSSSIVSMLGLVVVLLTTAVIPVDIFLVAFMKDDQGHFKPWAESNETRQSLQQDVLYTYYAMYMCVMLFLFLLLPFSYFFYEEADEDVSNKSRTCTALKYTLVFAFAAAVLLLIGAFAPIKHIPHNNATDIDIITYLFTDTKTEDAISFCISCLTLLGMLICVLYTGYGMSAWPMDLVKGRRSATVEIDEVSHNRHETQTEIDTIRNRERNITGRLTSRDRQQLEELEERDRFLARREQHLDDAQRSCLTKCLLVLRPLQIFFGIMFFLMELIIFLSLLLTNIDKVLHSEGWRKGYALPKRHLPNPIDIILVYCQKVFPLDYILMTGIIVYFILCSMGGLQHLGIWCCCVRMYKIRIRRTKPQGLLLMCFLLMFLVLALNVIIFEITPQYTTFGSQKYVQYINETIGNHTSLVPHVATCSMEAPAEECIMTRMSMLLIRFFYKVWFFGAAYYYLSWAFLVIILIGFVVSLVRKRRSYIEGAVDHDDFDSDDEGLLQA